MDIFYYLKIGIIWYFMFLISIIVHEATHSIVASILGDKTAQMKGLASINPIPHIKREIIGMLVVPIISFIKFGFVIGWGSSPFNLKWATNYHRRLALLMLSGPLSNLCILFTASCLIYYCIHNGIFYKPTILSYTLVAFSSKYMLLAYILSITFSINLILLFLNILPLPTLDGSSLILFFIKKNKAIKMINIFFNKKLQWISLAISIILYIIIFRNFHEILVNFLYSF